MRAAAPEGVMCIERVSPVSDEPCSLHQPIMPESDEVRAAVRQDDRERAQLAAIVASSHDAIISKTLDGTILSWNAGAEQLYGYGAEEAVGHDIALIVPEERRAELHEISRRLRRGERISPLETVRRHRDGRLIDVSLTISPIHDRGGEVIATSLIARDISDRKAADALVEQQRHQLEQLVEERTTELETSHERLRMAERLATIGTLASGLGHDLNNLLFPIRCRLDSIESVAGGAAIKEDLRGVRRTLDQIQRLSEGLRLLAADPDDPRARTGATRLHVWRDDVETLLARALPKSVVLEFDIPEDLPPVMLSRHHLTQVVFNLLSNAGEAMGGEGRVVVTARRAAPDRVLLSVRDDGAGMTSDVRRFAMDPFFTTKKRHLSTGLGLPTARSLVERIGGSMQIDSAPERGTTVTIALPEARRSENGPPRLAGRTAAVAVGDARIAGAVASILRLQGITVRGAEHGLADDDDLWVTEGSEANVDAANRLLEQRPAATIVLISVETGALPHPSIITASGNGFQQVREAIGKAVQRMSEQP